MFLRVQLTALRCWLFMKKHFILDAWRSSEYACVQIAPDNVLCDHNKQLMGYFVFLPWIEDSLPFFSISEKMYWQHVFKKLEEEENHRLHLYWYFFNLLIFVNILPMHPEEQHLPFKQMRTTTIFSFRYTNPVLDHVLVHSVDKIQALAATVELIPLLF